MKIHIIGGAGSGKTYIAKIISDKYNLKSFDLDNIFWDNSLESYGVKNPEDIRKRMLNEILDNKSWIIEGVYSSWLQESFKQADIIFVLKPNIYLQHYRVTVRFIKRKLGIMSNKKKETIKGLIDLIKWNHGYNKKMDMTVKLIKESNERVIVIKNNEEVLKYIE